MIKKIDWYILKRYLTTFSVMILLFVPIGIVIDVSEKIHRILESNVPFHAVAQYYLDFTIYFANLLFPIFLFLSVIWFTSKLASNTEIVAILSSGISFNRFLRPYFVGATIVSLIALVMGFFLVPNASKGFNDFRYTYLKRNAEIREHSNVFRQLNEHQFLYVSTFNNVSKVANNFALETFDENQKLVSKITAGRLKWNPDKKNYTMINYQKRTVGDFGDRLESAQEKDTVFTFDLEDLTPEIYIAETLTLGELSKFIEKEKARGNSNVNVYEVQLYKKYSLPATAFILTFIAVAVSSVKRRGGMGINLAIGIVVGFSFVFFDKIFITLAEKSSMHPLIAVWLPNVIYGILAIYLLRNARR